MKDRAFLWTGSEKTTAFEQTSVRALGKNEEFLEDRIAENPEILGLDSLAGGIRGPYRVFQQLPLTSPMGRTIWPDIVLVSASGHLIAVEVKLADNPELLNRSVVAQVVEYATCLSLLDEEGLVAVLAGDGEETTLPELAQSWFPSCEDPDEFAEVLSDRCSRGEIDLLIACDRCPPGLRDLGGALDQLNALSFRLQVAEVAPWIVSGEPEWILFLNRTPIRTEIVARTQIEVSWDQNESPPTVTVNTTSLEEVEEALSAARRGASTKRGWTHEDIRSSFDDTSIENDAKLALGSLLEFCRENGYEGQVTKGKTTKPTFAFFVNSGNGKDGKRRLLRLWSATPGDDFLWVNRGSLQKAFGERLEAEASEKLIALFDLPEERVHDSWITIPIKAVGENFPAFGKISLWIKEQVSNQTDRAQ